MKHDRTVLGVDHRNGGSHAAAGWGKMSIATVRAQFAEVGLNLQDCYLEYEDKSGLQIISATGWHSDGQPFAARSTPFGGDPVERAKQFANDLVKLHTGEKPMAAPGNNLAEGIGEILNRLKERSDAAHSKLGASVDNMNEQVAGVEKMAADIDAAAAKIQGMLSPHTNGGPA